MPRGSFSGAMLWAAELKSHVGPPIAQIHNMLREVGEIGWPMGRIVPPVRRAEPAAETHRDPAWTPARPTPLDPCACDSPVRPFWKKLQCENEQDRVEVRARWTAPEARGVRSSGVGAQMEPQQAKIMAIPTGPKNSPVVSPNRTRPVAAYTIASPTRRGMLLEVWG